MKSFFYASASLIALTFGNSALALENQQIQSQQIIIPEPIGGDGGLPPIECCGSDVKQCGSLAESQKISISSAYITNLHTMPQVATFGLELAHCGAFVSQKILGNDQTNSIGYVAGRSGLVVANFWVMMAFQTSYHELGHAMRANAYGWRYSLHANRGGGAGKNRNFFGLFCRMMPRALGSASTAFSVKNDATKQQILSADAAGVNSTMEFGERIEDDMYYNGGTWTYWAPHFRSKTESLFYKMDRGDRYNDMANIVNTYKSMGIQVRKSDIDLANIVSLIASGSTYKLASGMCGFVASGRQQSLSSYEFHKFRMPETSAYLTPSGLSYKLKSGYKFDESLKTIFGVEYVAKGKHTAELSLGAQKKLTSFNGTSLRGNMAIGKGLDLEASILVPVPKQWSFEIGISRYCSKNLYGGRNIVNAKKNKKYDTYIWGQMSWVYGR